MESEMEIMKFCPKCGQELIPGAAFCPKCGQKLRTDETITTQSSQNVTSQQTTPFVEVPPMNPQSQTPPPLKTPNPTVKKVIAFFKKFWIPLVATAVVLLVALGVFNYISNQPVDVSKTAKVTFDGYDTQGTASYNSDKIYKKITEEAYKKVGFKEKDVKGLLKGDGDITSRLQKMKGYAEKMTQASVIGQNVTVKLNKSDGLKNGDKVTLTIKDKNNKEDKIITDTKKEFTVKGLDEIEAFTLNDLLKDVKYEFTGYNGFGMLEVTNNPYEDISETIFTNQEDQEADYSNGDKITLEINPSIIDANTDTGHEFTGDTTLEVEVKDLKDVMGIEKREDVLTQIDTYAKAQNKSNDYNTYKIERQESYLRGKNTSTDWWGDSSEAELTFDIESIYKITHTYKSGDTDKSETYYRTYGYTTVPVENNAFQTKDLEGGSAYSWSQENSLEDCINTLKADYPDFEKI